VNRYEYGGKTELFGEKLVIMPFYCLQVSHSLNYIKHRSLYWKSGYCICNGVPHTFIYHVGYGYIEIQA